MFQRQTKLIKTVENRIYGINKTQHSGAQNQNEAKNIFKKTKTKKQKH